MKQISTIKYGAINMIYFDNAATTYIKPKNVYDSLADTLLNYGANAGRSSHSLAAKTSEKVFETREKISGFFDIDTPENVVFTTNATYALNIAIKGLIKKGEHILISDMEHNSVLRPIEALKDEGYSDYSVFTTTGDLEKNITSQIKPDTKIIVSNLMSNVNGREVDYRILCKIAKTHKLKLIVDASQIAGHKKISMSHFPDNSVLCAPAHKGLFGIQGAGFAIFKSCNELKPLIEGGSGSESKSRFMPKLLPERLEAGTLPIPSIISLGCGIDYINKIGIDKIEEKINILTDKISQILSEQKNVIFYGGNNGVISFNIKGQNSEYTADILNTNDIFVRAGFHCAPLAHKTLGTYKCGTCRISLSYFNKINEVDILNKVLKENFS